MTSRDLFSMTMSKIVYACLTREKLIFQDGLGNLSHIREVPGGAQENIQGKEEANRTWGHKLCDSGHRRVGECALKWRQTLRPG